MASIREGGVPSPMVLFADFVLSLPLHPTSNLLWIVPGRLSCWSLALSPAQGFSNSLDSDNWGCPPNCQPLTSSSFTVQTCSLPYLSSFMPEVLPAQPSPAQIPFQHCPRWLAVLLGYNPMATDEVQHYWEGYWQLIGELGSVVLAGAHDWNNLLTLSTTRDSVRSLLPSVLHLYSHPAWCGFWVPVQALRKKAGLSGTQPSARQLESSLWKKSGGRPEKENSLGGEGGRGGEVLSMVLNNNPRNN